MNKVEHNKAEKEAHELIGKTMKAIMNLNPERELTCNYAELVQAVHVLQDFVKQHFLHRIYPEAYSDWWVEL